jgi:hypothetical protein
MQVRKRVAEKTGHGLFGFPGVQRRVAAVPEEPCQARGLSPCVRFFVDYSISVAVNSVARKQALRAKLLLSGSNGLTLNVVVSTLEDASGCKFVAYSNDMSLFLNSSTGLFVINQTPRELEHSIYLYLSERLTGQESVGAEVVRESNSSFGLPVLAGCSEEGPRSLRVKGSSAGN